MARAGLQVVQEGIFISLIGKQQPSNALLCPADVTLGLYADYVCP